MSSWKNTKGHAWVNNQGQLVLEGGYISDGELKFAIQQMNAKQRWLNKVQQNLDETRRRLLSERQAFLKKWRGIPRTMAQDARAHMAWKRARKLPTKFVQVPWNKRQRTGFKKFMRVRNSEKK